LLTLTEEELILLEKQRKVIIKINYNNGNIRMCKLRSLLDEFLYDTRVNKLLGYVGGGKL